MHSSLPRRILDLHDDGCLAAGAVLALNTGSYGCGNNGRMASKSALCTSINRRCYVRLKVLLLLLRQQDFTSQLALVLQCPLAPSCQCIHVWTTFGTYS